MLWQDPEALQLGEVRAMLQPLKAPIPVLNSNWTLLWVAQVRADILPMQSRSSAEHYMPK
eukprot:5599240-Amphidinium_carterae.3